MQQHTEEIEQLLHGAHTARKDHNAMADADKSDMLRLFVEENLKPLRPPEDPEEWAVLDGFCRITISRFFRDRGVYQTLQTVVLPDLVSRAHAAGSPPFEIWSAGCGAGDEPYSLAILLQELANSSPDTPGLHILASDADERQLQRARTAIYPESCLREVSREIRDRAFESVEPSMFRLRGRFREGIEWLRQDLRREMPVGPFHLILCRNLAFTYFDTNTQMEVLQALLLRLATGGYLVIGAHETLPSESRNLPPHPDCPCVLGPKGEPAESL